LCHGPGFLLEQSVNCL